MFVLKTTETWKMSIKHLLQASFIFIELSIQTQMKYRINFPILFELFDSQSLEQVFPSEEIGFECRKEQAFTETARPVLKDADRYLRFVFITGVTKFSQLGIFSNLNQLMDISMAPDYATICGMTKVEIERDFQPELAALATMNKLTYEQTVNEMTKRYDGYHFSEFLSDGIYNPFSVLNALVQKRFSSYWFATGTPTMLVDTAFGKSSV